MKEVHFLFLENGTSVENNIYEIIFKMKENKTNKSNKTD
jgi:hypothetical protein